MLQTSTLTDILTETLPTFSPEYEFMNDDDQQIVEDTNTTHYTVYIPISDFFVSNGTFGVAATGATLKWMVNLVTIAATFKIINQYISFLGIFLNLFHLIILTRKSMRTTSTNIMMLGISISDITCMITIILFNRMNNNDFQYNTCIPPPTYAYLQTLHIIDVVQYTFRRTSLWLAVVMTTVRWFSIKYPMSSKVDILSKPIIGWVAQLFSLSIISPFTIVYYLQLIIKQYFDWIPGKTCTEFYKGYTQPFYTYGGFFEDEISVLRVSRTSDAFISKIIPCFILPTMTLLLVMQLKTISKLRQKVSESSKKGDMTSTIVIAIAVTYIIVEIPTAALLFYQSRNTAVQGTYKVIDECHQFIWPIYLINGSIHCVICFWMSSHYRNVVKSVIHYERWRKKKEVVNQSSVMTVNSVG